MPRTLALSDRILDDIGLLFDTDDPTGSHAWLDTEALAVVHVTDLYGLDEEDDDDDLDEELPDWQQEEREQVRAILADETDRYLEIPIGRLHGEPGVLLRFWKLLPSGPLADRVYDAQRGRGAFRRVKDLLQQAGEIERWYAFERERQRRAVLDWLDDEGFRVEGQVYGDSDTSDE